MSAGPLPALLARLARRVARTATHPALAGVATLLVLFVSELVSTRQLGMMGLHDEEIQRRIFRRFGAYIVEEQLAVAATYALIGAGWGLLATTALALWDRARALPDSPHRARSLRRWLSVAAFVALVELWRFAITVVHYPQLFDETLYARGGWRRAVEIALTDHVPRAALEAVGWAAIALLCLGWLARASGRTAALTQVRRLAGRVPQRRAAASASLALALGVALAATLLARGGRSARATQPAPTPSTRPNVLVLAVDSLRADRVGRGHESIAPHLARLAARGVHFTAAHVTIPRTFPSWMTLLTGRYPARHGIRTMFPSSAERSLVARLDPLPARFHRAGFATVVESDFAGEIFSRVDVGFDERRVPYFDLRTVVAQAGLNLHPGLLPYLATATGHALAPALETAGDNADPERFADRVLDTIGRHADRPFFVTAFFSTVHFPYAAPDPWYRKFTSRSYAGRYRYHKPAPSPDEPDSALTPDDITQVRGLYDGAVAATDAAIGRILDGLAARGLADRTIVVLLADHGENLYEGAGAGEGPARGMGHGEHLHGDHALNIPLVIYDPIHRFPAHEVPGIVRDVDLAPTLAALAGLPPSTVSDPPVDGVDLAPLLRGEQRDLGLPAFAETGLWFTAQGPGFGPDERLPYPVVPVSLTLEHGDDIVLQPDDRRLVVIAKHRALRDGRWKLYYEPTRAGVHWSLHDLVADPEERQNIALQHPRELATLKDRLREWLAIGDLAPDGDGAPAPGGWSLVNDFVVPR